MDVEEGAGMTEIFIAIIAGYCVGTVVWEIEQAIRRAAGRRRARIWTARRRARQDAFREVHPGAVYHARNDAWLMPDGHWREDG